MLDTAFHLGLTGRVLAAPSRFPLFPFQLGTANRARRWHFKNLFTSLPLIRKGLKHLRDDQPALFHDDPVPYPQVFPFDLILVVQGCPADRGSLEYNRATLHN